MKTILSPSGLTSVVSDAAADRFALKGWTIIATGVPPVAVADSLLDRVEGLEERQDTELAYGVSSGGATNQAAATSGTAAEIPGCLITIGPVDLPVWMECQAIFQQTTAGVGNAYLYIYEMNHTTGALTLFTSFVQPLPNSTAATTKFVQVGGKIRMGRLLTERSFILAALSTSAAQTLNNALNPSFLGAYTA